MNSQIDLRGGLEKLGVTDVFHYGASDFGPMTEDMGNLFVGEAKHGARVKIDEAGVIAAAYTQMQVWLGMARPPEEEMDFVVDRPFLFVITSEDNLHLFVGIVHQPVT
ncbi:MAG: serpin family protein [Oscillospiraceae bacterium]|nr:serpin family protein [Oscillospiraceae bacterium]